MRQEHDFLTVYIIEMHGMHIPKTMLAYTYIHKYIQWSLKN